MDLCKRLNKIKLEYIKMEIDRLKKENKFNDEYIYKHHFGKDDKYNQISASCRYLGIRNGKISQWNKYLI